MGDGFRSFKSACAILLACLVVGEATPSAAQSPGGTTRPAAERHEGTIIGGKPAPAPTFERCVDVQIGNQSAFGCLNQKLKREVDRVNPSINLPPIDARSPDVRVGNVNEAAVRQQYGPNYGRSVIPYRPPVPTYVLPRR
jgi:hypothetical protein